MDNNASMLDTSMLNTLEKDDGGPETTTTARQCKSSPRTVLVIEDDSYVATVLQFLLERGGYAVTVLADGYAAMKHVQEAADVPGLVLLEVLLPIADGYEVMHAIRRQQQWAGVPIIVVSKRNDESDVMRAFSAGAADYVTKPFQLGELLARVKRLIKEPVH